MVKSILSVFLILSSVWVSMLQSQTSVLVETGVLAFDLQPADGDISRRSNGWGTQSSLVLVRSWDTGRKWRPMLGMGYAFQYMWDASPIFAFGSVEDPSDLHYAQIRYGIEYDFGRRWTAGVTGVHYIVLGKLISDEHQRSYMNLEPFLAYRLSSRSSLTISSPLTITKMSIGPYTTQVLPGPGSSFQPAPEINGLLLGYSYSF